MDGSVRLASNGTVPTWPRESLTKLEDLELALDAAVRVNKHLHAEAAALVSDLRRTQRERDAWRAHAQQLARTLASERRRRAGASSSVSGGAAAAAAGGQAAAGGGGEQASSSGGEAAAAAGAAEEADAEAAALAELPSTSGSGGADSSGGPFAWPGGAGGAVAALTAKGRAAGWLAAPGDIELGPLLGAGAFGETHRARWRGCEIAVKKVRVGGESELVNFLREVECLAALRHPGVVPFLGAVVQGAGHCWLLSEFMTGGNMAAYLHGAKTSAAAAAAAAAAAQQLQRDSAQQQLAMGRQRPLIERLQRALEIAAALAALEACSPPVLHRDVKPSNIFIDGAGRARLGDFGLARLLPASAATLTGETGTYLYMAPEMIRHEVYDSKADVWSFGVLLAEIITGQIPYQHTYMTPVQIAMAVADEQLQPALPASLPASLLVIAHACCDFDPDMRPTFATVVEELGAAVKELQEQEEAAAARGGLFERILASAAVPSSWAGVLSQLAGGE